LHAYLELLGTTTQDTLAIDGNAALSLSAWSGGLGLGAAWRPP
jgi:hypothetical protein